MPDIWPTKPNAPSDWIVQLHDDFEAEFEELAADVQDGLLAAAKAVQIAGPRKLIANADQRFDRHLRAISARKSRSK